MALGLRHVGSSLQLVEESAFGDGPAEGVKVHALLSEGLEHAKGNKVEFEVGNLAPGESRAVQLICGTKAGGPQRCDGIAEAGEGCIATIEMPQVHPLIAPLVYAVPVQLLAYHTAVLKGTDVDQPRNLAKSVTVE